MIAEIAKSSSAYSSSWDCRLRWFRSQAIKTLESIKIPMVIQEPYAFVSFSLLPRPNN